MRDWKSLERRLNPKFAVYLKPTYEGLKEKLSIQENGSRSHLKPTYEGLKAYRNLADCNHWGTFKAYLWGIERGFPFNIGYPVS